MGMRLERGEVRWYTFKSPDKKRPIVILTRDSAIDYLGELTVAPITSTIRSIPTEVILNEKDGIQNLCAINLDHIQTVSKDKIDKIITKLSPDKLKEITIALNFALGFDISY
jgi:mRNA interferase MazF